MNYTQVFEHYINYGGVYADTSKLFKDVGKNRINQNRLEKFYEEQQAKGLTFSDIKSRYMLRGVSSDDIADLLKHITIPSVNKRFDCASLAAYIKDSRIFRIWDVVVAKGESSRDIVIQGRNIPGTYRVFHLGEQEENYIRLGGHNNRIIDPGIFDSGVVITPEEKQDILSKKKKRRPDKPSDQLTATDWLKLRETPLLAIYYIDLKIDNEKLSLTNRDRCLAVKEAFGNDLLVGFAVGFPARESKVLIQYRANLVKAEELNSDDDEFDEEELSDE